MKDLQEIIDGIPKDEDGNELATHVCVDGDYYDVEHNVMYKNGSWHNVDRLYDLRSLADIKQILELQEQNESSLIKFAEWLSKDDNSTTWDMLKIGDKIAEYLGQQK